MPRHYRPPPSRISPHVHGAFVMEYVEQTWRSVSSRYYCFHCCASLPDTLTCTPAVGQKDINLRYDCTMLLLVTPVNSTRHSVTPGEMSPPPRTEHPIRRKQEVK